MNIQSTEAKNGAEPSLAERIEAQRPQILKAMNIIEACRMGSDSMLATLTGEDEPDFADALAAAHELLNAVAAELEAIGDPA